MNDSTLYDALARLEARVNVLEQHRHNYDGHIKLPSEPPTVGELLTKDANSDSGDEATVEALITAMSEAHTGCRSEAREMASAILAAVKAGRIPRLRYEDPEDTMDLSSYASARAEIERLEKERDELCAKVAGLTKACDDMEHNADHNAQLANEYKKERDELREEVAKLKARKVKLPYRLGRLSPQDWAHNGTVYECQEAIRSAGIAIEGEEKL